MAGLADRVESRKPIEWVNAGRVHYFAVAEEHMVALLYWDEAGLGEEGGPGGEPVVTDPGWVLVLADDPTNHEALVAPSLRGVVDHEEIVHATHAAFDAASRIVADALNERRLI